MLWFRKQPDAAAARDEIVPAELPLPLDAALFERHYAELHRLAEGDTGIEAYLESLAAKHRLFAEALAPGAMDGFGFEQLESLLEFVPSARRRVFPAVARLGEQGCRELVRALILGPGALEQRMEAFVAAVPVPAGEGREAQKAALKLKRALFDLAAELLHFNDPVRYPLMTRWVWDQAAESGALREFIRGADHMPHVELGSAPAVFEGARKWLAERLAEQGLYRDVHFWIDMMQAQAYASYFRSVAEGVLSAEFGRGGGPEEHLKRFLGIDVTRRDGRSRVKKTPEGAALH